ncbi:840_t:CDS:2 [Ambispora gerdemannii]|uniref:840_t:CDS:1 n=1 Tax=Ambispora gerdemannii TaxID=144530 RepID=A0A9N9GBT7_9GLOM|nr:840_t:CDS:2 [Ambispora gerdemannii]
MRFKSHVRQTSFIHPEPSPSSRNRGDLHRDCNSSERRCRITLLVYMANPHKNPTLPPLIFLQAHRVYWNLPTWHDVRSERSVRDFAFIFPNKTTF